MKHIFILFLLTVIFSNLFGYQPTADGEEEAIRKAVIHLYVKGLQTRDFSLIREICIDEARLYGVRNDSNININTLDKWEKRFDPNNPPFKSLDYKIKKIDWEGNAAQVKILFTIDEKREVHDFLNLLKVKGKWRIINIIDN